jgi:hypothetical protein
MGLLSVVALRHAAFFPRIGEAARAQRLLRSRHHRRGREEERMTRTTPGDRPGGAAPSIA